MLTGKAEVLGEKGTGCTALPYYLAVLEMKDEGDKGFILAGSSH